MDKLQKEVDEKGFPVIRENETEKMVKEQGFPVIREEDNVLSGIGGGLE